MDAGQAARAGGDFSALILVSRITLPHFSVSSAMNLAKSAGEPASAVAPHSGRQALTWESSKPALTTLIERVDDLGRQAFWPCDAGPEPRLVARTRTVISIAPKAGRHEFVTQFAMSALGH